MREEDSQSGREQDAITICGASTHNLQGIDLRIPRNRLVVVTGVSGSGKSSLAFDTIYREGARRYLETFSAFARQHLAKLERPPVDSITGLPPVIAVSQLAGGAGSRSTVGTLSQVYDLLRLLFARCGLLKCPDCQREVPPPYPQTCPQCDASLPVVSRSLFSFNSPHGACPACNGRGSEEAVDPALLVAEESLSLRQGAMVPTLKRGYIVYSQVTMEVLNDVCNAHGFDVDTPWNELSSEQQDVIFYGSTRLKVPFGKHTLESRLKWTGLTAKPREEGYYKGLVPVIEETLKRNRNANILRFVSARTCRTCEGSRLQPHAHLVAVGSQTIGRLVEQPLLSLLDWLKEEPWGAAVTPIAGHIAKRLGKRLAVLTDLGLGYLTLSRTTDTLAPGERQRIRLSTQSLGGLTNVLYVLDEPSIGLHPADTGRLLKLLRRLIANGSSVVVVEHDPDVIAAADHVIELGPGAGPGGGRVTYQGPPRPNCALPSSATHSWKSSGRLHLTDASLNNLNGVSASFQLGALNLVCGPAGAGKKSLLLNTLVPALERSLVTGRGPTIEATLGGDTNAVRNVVVVDNAPIGRTPRSNAATYTKLWDVIRKLYAKEPAAIDAGFGASRFSFNTSGGRCESCQGAGVQQLGLFFLGNVGHPCPDCQGRRFDAETLAVTWEGRTVSQLLDMTVEEALPLLASAPKATQILQALADVGLGYISLGQPSTTLSGGEAQRVKLATHLARPPRGHTVYVLEEPTTGLHERDVTRLLSVLMRLVDTGHTVIAMEHDRQFIQRAHHIVEMGPGSGAHGGEVVVEGTPADLLDSEESPTGRHMRASPPPMDAAEPPAARPRDIHLRGITTHNLKGLDVSIEHQKVTVVTGPSGSGKSSLAFDTLFAESQRRFSEGLSTYAKRFLSHLPRPSVEEATGLTPAIAVHQRSISGNPRSTLATVTDTMDHLRLLWSRLGDPSGLSAGHFSFNRQEGACMACGGLGLVRTTDPSKLISAPDQSLLGGAMNGHRTGRFYSDPGNRFVHVLRAAGDELGIDFQRPWEELPDEAQIIAMYGAGPKEFEATWEFDRKGRKGRHTWTSNWPGFVHYIDEEYARKHASNRGEALVPLMKDIPCGSCQGERLTPEARAVTVRGIRLPELLNWTVDQTLAFLDETREESHPKSRAVWDHIAPAIRQTLAPLQRLGLGYLTLSRRTPTLSGGEARRVRLATQLGGRLHGATYVLDEPTIGLHPRDTSALVDVLMQLRDEGNTVVVVEHDDAVIKAADRVLTLGPGGGSRGGELIDKVDPPPPVSHPSGSPHSTPQMLEFAGCRAQNLQGINTSFRVASLNSITGVSGAGKSTLLTRVIHPSLREGRPLECDTFTVPTPYRDVRWVDASPIGRTPMSTPATYLKLLDRLRTLFANASAARHAGLTASHFSYISPKGRCPQCKGSGHRQVTMDFMADVWVPCDLCGGRRYASDILSVRWRGHTISGLLELTIEEATELCNDDPTLGPVLATLCDLGLDYLPLGQSATTLSGGEAQRLKLAAELIRPETDGSVIFLLDEPTRGLASSDVGRLLTVLHGLAEAGHTLIAVEHNLRFVHASAHIVDLGPDGGSGGGRVVAQGSPDDVARSPESATGAALRAWRKERKN